VNYFFEQKPSKESQLNLKHIDRHFMKNCWSEESWDHFSFEHHAVGWIEIQKEMIGFALYDHLPGDPYAHLLKIVVRLTWQRKGIGEHILVESEKRLKLLGVQTFGLEVAIDNFNAINLYQKMGYKTLRALKGFYSDGTDACAMSKDLRF
jgi:ribosomal protein S18 acetylase RimI-like enzyme